METSKRATVENILFKEYSRADLADYVRKSIRHWTVLINNDIMRCMFSSEDWKAIVAGMKPLPQLNRPISDLLEQFRAVCI